VVSETAARLILLTYNLWSLFVRVVKEQGVHSEAITSRDELLLISVKLVESGRQKTLKLGVGEKWCSHQPSLQAAPALVGLNCAAVGLPADLRALSVLE
jgi:hypothetical protein